jgi:hypothetical protein
MYCFISKTKKIPKNELRLDVITSFSNTINKTNEGKKHGSYDRVLLKRKKVQLCKTKIM